MDNNDKDIKEVGNYVILTKTAFVKYQKAFDQHKYRLDYSRKYMKKKYDEHKQQKQLKHKELETELESTSFFDEDVIFQLKNTN